MVRQLKSIHNMQAFVTNTLMSKLNNKNIKLLITRILDCYHSNSLSQRDSITNRENVRKYTKDLFLNHRCTICKRFGHVDSNCHKKERVYCKSRSSSNTTAVGIWESSKRRWKEKRMIQRSEINVMVVAVVDTNINKFSGAEPFSVKNVVIEKNCIDLLNNKRSMIYFVFSHVLTFTHVRSVASSTGCSMSEFVWMRFANIYFPGEKIAQPTAVRVSFEGIIEFHWAKTTTSATRVLMVIDERKRTSFLYNRKPRLEMNEYFEISQEVFDKLRCHLSCWTWEREREKILSFTTTTMDLHLNQLIDVRIERTNYDIAMFPWCYNRFVVQLLSCLSTINTEWTFLSHPLLNLYWLSTVLIKDHVATFFSTFTDCQT